MAKRKIIPLPEGDHIPVNTLVPNKKNPRTITESELDKLRNSIDEFPKMMEMRPLVVDEKLIVLGGNQRLAAIKALKFETIPRSWVLQRTDLTAKEKREFIVKDNTEAGTWDIEMLADSWSNLPLAEWGVDLPLDWIGKEPKKEDEEAVADAISKAAELQKKWKTKAGQLWQLSEHRVLCGDSTKKEDVGRLMDGAKADMVFTDPPYGIKRDEGFGGFGGFGTPIARTKYKGGWDEDRPSKECFDLMLSLAPKALIFGGNYFADYLPQGKHWIVWDKKNTMPTFGDAELIWTNFERDSVKIIEFEYNGLIGKEKERFHATQKPVGLFTTIIRGFDDNVLVDPFLGSGTTLIACEQTNRKCYGMEISEAYIAVCLERFYNLTGVEPVLEE